MQHKHAIECVDQILPDLIYSEVMHQGNFVPFLCDPCQILWVVPHENIYDKASACLKSSYLQKEILASPLTCDFKTLATTPQMQELVLGSLIWYPENFELE